MALSVFHKFEGIKTKEFLVKTLRSLESYPKTAKEKDAALLLLGRCFEMANKEAQAGFNPEAPHLAALAFSMETAIPDSSEQAVKCKVHGIFRLCRSLFFPSEDCLNFLVFRYLELTLKSPFAAAYVDTVGIKTPMMSGFPWFHGFFLRHASLNDPQKHLAKLLGSVAHAASDFKAQLHWISVAVIVVMHVVEKTFGQQGRLYAGYDDARLMDTFAIMLKTGELASVISKADVNLVNQAQFEKLCTDWRHWQGQAWSLQEAVPNIIDTNDARTSVVVDGASSLVHRLSAFLVGDAAGLIEGVVRQYREGMMPKIQVSILLPLFPASDHPHPVQTQPPAYASTASIRYAHSNAMDADEAMDESIAAKVCRTLQAWLGSPIPSVSTTEGLLGHPLSFMIIRQLLKMECGEALFVVPRPAKSTFVDLHDFFKDVERDPKWLSEQGEHGSTEVQEIAARLVRLSAIKQKRPFTLDLPEDHVKLPVNEAESSRFKSLASEVKRPMVGKQLDFGGDDDEMGNRHEAWAIPSSASTEPWGPKASAGIYEDSELAKSLDCLCQVSHGLASKAVRQEVRAMVREAAGTNSFFPSVKEFEKWVHDRANLEHRFSKPAMDAATEMHKYLLQQCGFTSTSEPPERREQSLPLAPGSPQGLASAVPMPQGTPVDIVQGYSPTQASLAPSFHTQISCTLACQAFDHLLAQLKDVHIDAIRIAKEGLAEKERSEIHCAVEDTEELKNEKGVVSVTIDDVSVRFKPNDDPGKRSLIHVAWSSEPCTSLKRFYVPELALLDSDVVEKFLRAWHKTNASKHGLSNELIKMAFETRHGYKKQKTMA